MNVPSGLTAADLVDGSIFQNYMPLSQLGVQAPPGTKFYVNGANTPVIVGFSGMFDINFNQGGSITGLAFDTTTLSTIAANDSMMLIIDMAYTGGGY